MSPIYPAQEAADLLMRSRIDGHPLAALPDPLAPDTLAQAYAVQDATLERLGPSGGWKVAAKPDSEPRCAVIPACNFYQSGALIPVPDAGFDVEVEVAFVFARDLVGRDTPYAADEVAEAIGSLHLAIELISSRFVDRKKLSPFSPIADLQSNAGVILGPEMADWRDLPLEALQLTLDLDRERIGLPVKNASFAATLPVLVWLANHAVARGHGLKRGDAVITGARIGPVSLGARSRMVASCDGFGDLLAEFQH